jgi:hypothetical protein
MTAHHSPTTGPADTIGRPGPMFGRNPESESTFRRVCAVLRPDVGRHPPMGLRGPKGKGPRYQIPVRLPIPLYEQVAEMAARDGIPIGDYLVRSLAEAHGHPVPDYCRPRSTGQTELPMATAS